MCTISNQKACTSENCQFDVIEQGDIMWRHLTVYNDKSKYRICFEAILLDSLKMELQFDTKLDIVDPIQS